MRTDRRLDVSKLTGDSRDDANATKNIKVDLKGQDVCGNGLSSFRSWQDPLVFVV